MPYDTILQSDHKESQIKWSFFDYLKVVEAVKRQTWQDEMKGWSIYGMFFGTSCSDSSSGFYFGDFLYFRPVTTDTGNKYEAREVWISSQLGRVYWGSGNYYSKPLLGWHGIDVDKIVSPDNILQIADNNGGKAARQKVNNVCNIFLSYNPNLKTDTWHLMMSYNNQLPSIFEIQINPYNGKFRVIE